MNYQLSVGFNGKKDTLLKIINSSNKVGDVYTGEVLVEKSMVGVFNMKILMRRLKRILKYAINME